MSGPLVFLDTETTGLHPQRRAWEVAAIRREPDGSEAHHAWFIDVPLDEADPAALRFGRFYERHPLHTRSLGDCWDESTAARAIDVVTRGAQLVGSNPAFDAATLDAMLRRHGLLPSWHYQLIDVVPLAAGHLPRTRRPAPPWRSYEVSELCGVPRPSADVAHTAMGDALWTRDLYDAVTRGAQR